MRAGLCALLAACRTGRAAGLARDKRQKPRFLSLATQLLSAKAPQAAWSCLLAAFAGAAAAADIDVTGHWSRIVNRADLIDGAGTDIVGSIESPPAVATLDITGTADAPWTVLVAMEDVGWPPDASVSVRRSGNDSGISGGASYLPIDGTSRVFFSGTGDRTGIQIQIRVAGVDIHTAPALYSVTITYSVQSP